MTMDEYKTWYLAEYKHLPSGKLVESFLRLHPEPDPTPDEFWQEEELELPKFELRRVDN